jgi:hypothetical protein
MAKGYAIYRRRLARHLSERSIYASLLFLSVGTLRCRAPLSCAAAACGIIPRLDPRQLRRDTRSLY